LSRFAILGRTAESPSCSTIGQERRSRISGVDNLATCAHGH